MTTTFLISENKVREFTSLNNSVDIELIKNCIRTAQDYRLQSIIGTVLYKKLLSDVENDSLSGNYKTLVDDYIQDFLLYAVYYETLEEIFIRPRNNGLLTPNGGETSDSVDLTVYNVKRESVENKMKYYADQLTKYILEEEGLFPELQLANKLYETEPDYSTKYGSPFVFRDKIRTAIEFEKRGIPVRDRSKKQYPPN